MKMQREHSVPLSEAALRIIADQMGHRGKSAFAFPGGRPRQPLSNMALSMLLRRLEIDATVHGFRSSARSWMADNGVEFELAEACLAHVVGNSVVQAYQRSSMLERRRPLMERWAKFLSGETDAKVVHLKHRIRRPLRARS
jgi:integrase